MLEAIAVYLRLKKIEAERVTLVKFRVDNRGSDSVLVKVVFVQSRSLRGEEHCFAVARHSTFTNILTRTDFELDEFKRLLYLFKMLKQRHIL